jgi:hypothetical protein
MALQGTLQNKGAVSFGLPFYGTANRSAYRPQLATDDVEATPIYNLLAMDSPFGRLMHVETIPIMTVAIYLLAIFYMNRKTKGRLHKPWIPTTRGAASIIIFTYNSAVSAFSAWVFISSFRILQRRWPSSSDANYVSRAVDIICNVDGGHPNGFQPIRDDPSRSDSIAYYVWLFYLSKYIEIVDHVITLIKGKEVSFMHAFHQSGAILVSWVASRSSEIGRLGVASLAGMMLNTAFHSTIVCQEYSFLMSSKIYGDG